MNHTTDVKNTCVIITILGAFCFAMSFYHQCFVWAIFLFLIPNFFVIQQKKGGVFWYGFLWMISALTVHSSGVFYCIITKASQWYGGVILMLIILFYYGMCGGIWWLLLGKVSKGHVIVQSGIRAFVTVLFFFFITHLSFFIVGLLQGYILFFPLIPLAHFSYSWGLLLMQNVWGVLFALCCLQELCMTYCRCIVVRSIVINVTIAMLSCHYYQILVNSGIQEHYIGSLNSTEIVCFKGTNVQQHPYDRAHYWCEQMMRAQENTAVKLFILPESSFPFAVNEYPYVTYMWQKNILQSEDQLIVCGAHFRERDVLFNSFFVINKCRITQRYDKLHLVPLFEYLPKFTLIQPVIKNLFFHKKELFSQRKNESVQIISIDKMTFIPVLCSEIFWNDYSDFLQKLNRDDSISFICLLRDDHFGLFPFYKLMLLAARFRAIHEKRKILYCSFLLAYLIENNGKLVELKQFS